MHKHQLMGVGRVARNLFSVQGNLEQYLTHFCNLVTRNVTTTLG